MTIVTLAYALVFGSLVAVAAAALDACLRLGKRATRGVWLAALGVTLAGTVLARERAPVPTGPAAAGVAASAAVPNTSSLVDRIVQSIATVRSVALHLADRALARIPAAHIPSLDRSLTVGWIAVSLAVLALLIAVHVHFRRACRAWPETTVDGTRVRLAPRTGPAVIGLIDPEIVVPAWLMTRANVEQRLVLDHEREHLRARDPLLLSAAYIATALMPWHPAIWWMLARLRLAVELDCDARVLRRGVTARSYGALLIDLAGRGAAATGVPALGLTLTNLERRLIAMTPHRRSHSFVRGSLLAGAAMIAFAIACNAPVPTSPHHDDAVRAQVGDATRTVRIPDDTGLVRIDRLLAKVQADPVRMSDGIRYKLTLDPVAGEVGKRIAYWLRTDFPKPRAAVGHVGASTAGVIDPSAAVRVKILVDSAQSAMIHAKRSMGVSGHVMVDDRPTTTLYLTQIVPDRIEIVGVNKHAKSTALSKVTPDH